MNEFKILTWKELVGLLIPNYNFSDSSKIKDLSSLITKTRSEGIGNPVNYQKTKYSEEDLDILKNILNWWQLLNQNSNNEFRDEFTSKNIQSVLIDAVKNNKGILVYSVFCPSYKKGVGEFGYTGAIGKHTRHMIETVVNFINQSNEVGLKTEGVIFFSDLLLENYEKLLLTNYKKQLENNFEEFKSYFLSLDKKHHINVKLLSELKEIKDKIGEEGITEGDTNIPLEVYQMVLDRNVVFYRDILGWSDSQIIERTKILARCYSYMGDFFRKIYPDGIMFWVESAYERGRMYSGMTQNNPLPIIYPVKNG